MKEYYLNWPNKTPQPYSSQKEMTEKSLVEYRSWHILLSTAEGYWLDIGYQPHSAKHIYQYACEMARGSERLSFISKAVKYIRFDDNLSLAFRILELINDAMAVEGDPNNTKTSDLESKISLLRLEQI